MRSRRNVRRCVYTDNEGFTSQGIAVAYEWTHRWLSSRKLLNFFTEDAQAQFANREIVASPTL
jgi:hypothetical protein